MGPCISGQIHRRRDDAMQIVGHLNNAWAVPEKKNCACITWFEEARCKKNHMYD